MQVVSEEAFISPTTIVMPHYFGVFNLFILGNVSPCWIVKATVVGLCGCGGGISCMVLMVRLRFGCGLTDFLDDCLRSWMDGLWRLARLLCG